MSEDTQRFDIQVRNAEPDEGETPDWETIRRDLSPEKTVDEIASMTREDIMEVGRPVWTHEFADFDLLAHEVLTGSVPTMDGILDKLPHDKPVIPVVVTNGDASKGSNNDQH